MELEQMFSELSARQANILKSLAHGHTNEQIGQQEGISERTVEYHIGNLIEIFSIGDRYNPRTRLAHKFYSRAGEAFMEVLRGS